jgi:hypothetical protein
MEIFSMLSRVRALTAIIALCALPGLAEAGISRADLKVGDRVLATGSLQRKCSAKIRSIAKPHKAKLRFDRPSCGDSSVVYEMRLLQRINFVKKAHNLASGDTVAVKGFFGNECSGRVREVSRSGYTSVALDSPLCADGAALFSSKDVKKVEFVQEAAVEDGSVSVGQKVSVTGIHEDEHCVGEIRKLTDNGLAVVAFKDLTCADGGKLYSVADMKFIKDRASHASGERIFQQVMREIASQKKSKKSARL